MESEKLEALQAKVLAILDENNATGQCVEDVEEAFAALTPPVDGGEFVMVPREATEAMVTEAVDNVGPIGCCSHSPATARETWAAMLAASPSRPSPSLPAPVETGLFDRCPSPSPEEDLRLKSDAFRAGFMAATRYNWERAEGMEEDYRENALTEWLTTPTRPT